MRFTKIYIEITNICNLNCSFCSAPKRKLESIPLDKFEYILKKIKPYTKTIYLHVKGEPLLYKNLDKLLTLTEQYKFNVRITTNGTLLKDKINILKKHKNIKQLNISLEAEQKKENYFEGVFYSCIELSKNIPIVLRIWLLDNYKLDKISTEIVDKIIEYFNLNKNFHQIVEKENNIKIQDNIYLDKDNKFTWPTDLRESNESVGTCFGTRTHIAILVNGDVVPCCLDSNAVLKLGNIFEENLEDILNSKLFKELNEGFKHKRLISNFCKNCGFRIQKLK